MAVKRISDLIPGSPPYNSNSLLELSIPNDSGFDSRKGLLADVVGNVHLQSGSISSPVSYLDLSLPNGFSSFFLYIQGLRFNIDSVVNAVLSQDGGSTFINDAINFDSYLHAFFAMNNSGLAAQHYVDSGIDLFFSNSGPTTDIGGILAWRIFPGSSAEWPAVTGETLSDISANLSFSYGSAIVNPAATVTPIKARADLIRLLPYGNGDSNPPTSAQTINAGSYLLMGVK